MVTVTLGAVVTGCLGCMTPGTALPFQRLEVTTCGIVGGRSDVGQWISTHCDSVAVRAVKQLGDVHVGRVRELGEVAVPTDSRHAGYSATVCISAI